MAFFSISNMSSPRRFPTPWSAEVQPNYYVVRDADGQPNYSYRLFEGVRVDPTLLFGLGFGLELVGVSLRVSLNLEVRDRRFLFDFACHVLWRQREGEGRGVIAP
jgi:hypothetical protein